MTQKARVLFMGTPSFAVPVLRALHEASNCEVVAVITQPDKPVGRKHVQTAPPVKVLAESLDLLVLQPKRVRSEAELAKIRELAPDVCVTAAYGQILPQALLDIPSVGCLNVHASLLPRWRGAAPIHRAIMAGDKVTGVTIMEMVAALDAGPILGTKQIPIEFTDDEGTLEEKLANIGASLLLDLLPGYIDGTRSLQEQSAEGAVYAHRIARDDEWIDWEKSALDTYNQIRGLSPSLGASTLWNTAPFKIWSAEPLENNSQIDMSENETGDVVWLPNLGVVVRCRSGWLKLNLVQPSGKKKMSAKDWYRGVQSQEIRLGAKLLS